MCIFVFLDFFPEWNVNRFFLFRFRSSCLLRASWLVPFTRSASHPLIHGGWTPFQWLRVSIVSRVVFRWLGYAAEPQGWRRKDGGRFQRKTTTTTTTTTRTTTRTRRVATTRPRAQQPRSVWKTMRSFDCRKLSTSTLMDLNGLGQGLKRLIILKNGPFQKQKYQDVVNCSMTLCISSNIRRVLLEPLDSVGYLFEFSLFQSCFMDRLLSA